MKVLMLSTDEGIFKDGSLSRERMKDYGALVDELHIVIVKNKNSKLKNQSFENVFTYPTNDRWKFLYFINAYKIAKKIIMASGQWLITTQDPFETGLVGWLIKKKFGLSLQIQVHTDFLSPWFWRESVRNKVRVILGKWLVKKSDGLRVVSERIKKSLIAIGHPLKSIMVLPIIYDMDRFGKAEINIDLRKKYPGRFIILMASRLTKEKNIGMAIRAFKKVLNLKSNVLNPLLLIVGEGPEREALQLLTFNFQLSTNVVFEPWTADLVSYYKTADLFLLTSNYEGYGRTLVEATAAGLPVLMTNVGVAIGSVVPVGDKKSLVKSLVLLIESREERNKAITNQESILSFYGSKEDYLTRLKESWQNCFL